MSTCGWVEWLSGPIPDGWDHEQPCDAEAPLRLLLVDDETTTVVDMPICAAHAVAVATDVAEQSYELTLEGMSLWLGPMP